MKQTELYLNREGVDAASQEIAVWLAELGVPSRDVLRIRQTPGMDQQDRAVFEM